MYILFNQVLFITCFFTTTFIGAINTQTPQLWMNASTLEDIEHKRLFGSINIDTMPLMSSVKDNVIDENPTRALEQVLIEPFRTDPDQALTCGQFIESRGFQYERHYVTTADGYILQNYRVINPLIVDKRHKKPVLLLHGFASSCASWFYDTPGGHIKPWINNRPPNDASAALGFHLANQGYDVWVINVRGNTYSTNHTHLNPYLDQKFWDFTFYDIAIYDVTATVDYIKKTTGYEKITVVGISQGTIQMLVQLSSMPKYEANYDLVILAAPIGYLGGIRGTFRTLADQKFLVKLAKLRLPYPPFLAIRDTTESVYCSKPINQLSCAKSEFETYGYDYFQLNKSRQSVYISTDDDQSSTKNLAHILQAVKSDHIRYFDYGRVKNLALYGSSKPPVFPYHQINGNKLILISGLNDFVTPQLNVKKLSKSLNGKPLVNYVIPFPFWNHLDFLRVIEAYRYFTSVVRQFIEKYGDN